MSKRGFTLVELLAVIVILAIILAVAIPSISNIITNARLNSFNASSKMLEKAAKIYLSINNITIENGTTTEVFYSDIKNAGYIDKVVDPISNNECSMSRVYITNTAGNYTYRGALVCDNYMNLNDYNLISNSDFSNGTTGWALNYGSGSISNNILSITGNGSFSRISVLTGSIPSIVGHVFYIRSRARVSGSGGTRLYFVMAFMQGGTWRSETGPSLSNPPSGTWYDLSKVYTVPSTPTGIDRQQLQILVDFPDAVTANGKVLQVDGKAGIYVFDLTSIYGTGNEPTLAQMDNIVNNMSK